MKPFEPNPASPEIEKEMEVLDLPESDREEVRRFIEVLRRRKDHREGKELPPAPEGMRDWLLGKDALPTLEDTP